MKKVFLFFTALWFLSSDTAAQDIGTAAQGTEVRTRFGIKAAPNLCWLRSDTKGLQNEGNRIGLSVGLMVEFPMGPTGNYRFATGLDLTSIGGISAYQYDVEVPHVITKVTSRDVFRFQFVELPLTIKMMTNEIGYMRYFGRLGVSGGVNTRARQDHERTLDENGVITTFAEDDIDIQSNTVPIRAALVLGGGAEYNVSGQTALLLGITYNRAIIRALEREAFPEIDNAKLLADYLELTLGVFF